MAYVLAYYALLLGVAVLALLQGGREERLAALICIAGTAATVLLINPLPSRFTAMESAVVLVDIAVLLAFVALALRSDRYWPLWIAGIQLTSVVGHLLKALQPELLPFIYGAALAFWSYPILLIIALAVIRTPRILSWREPAVG